MIGMVLTQVIATASIAMTTAYLFSLKGLFGKKEKKFKCPKCGADIDQAAKHCGRCHTAFDLGGYTCPNCKAPVSARDNECPNCGERFDTVESYACPECGTPVKVNTKKCPACGAKFWSPVKPSMSDDVGGPQGGVQDERNEIT